MDEGIRLTMRGEPPRLPPRGKLRPVEGWALEPVSRLDGESPGFLVHTLGASPKWRQAVYLSLAVGVLDEPEDFLLRANGDPFEIQNWKSRLRGVAGAMRGMSARRIVECCCREVPDGLMGCLGKIGDQPMRRAEDYRHLISLLEAPDRASMARARTLLQLDRLDADLITAVIELDEIALLPGILRRVRDGIEARRLNHRLDAIRMVCSGATDDALRQSLEDRQATFRGHDFAQAWLERADCPPALCPDVCSHPEFERVTPATAAEVGRLHSNCLGARAHRLVSGVWGAWVWKPGPLIATITRCEEGDLLTGVYAPGNREVCSDLARRLKSILRDLGVICFTRVEPPDETRLLTIGRFEDFDFDELDLA